MTCLSFRSSITALTGMTSSMSILKQLLSRLPAWSIGSGDSSMVGTCGKFDFDPMKQEPGLIPTHSPAPGDFGGRAVEPFFVRRATKKVRSAVAQAIAFAG